LLDAPHLRGNAAACGKIVSRIVGGACLAVDPSTGLPIPEADRVARILERALPENPGRTLAQPEVTTVDQPAPGQASTALPRSIARAPGIKRPPTKPATDRRRMITAAR